MTRPCFTPIVYTENNEYKDNGPNTTEIREKCGTAGCDPTCNRNGGLCVSYTYRIRQEGTGTNKGPFKNATSFCGTGRENSSTKYFLISTVPWNISIECLCLRAVLTLANIYS